MKIIFANTCIFTLKYVCQSRCHKRCWTNLQEIYDGKVDHYVVKLFGLFCGCRGLCHRTESDLFLFLLRRTWGILTITRNARLSCKRCTILKFLCICFLVCSLMFHILSMSVQCQVSIQTIFTRLSCENHTNNETRMLGFSHTFSLFVTPMAYPSFKNIQQSVLS